MFCECLKLEVRATIGVIVKRASMVIYGTLVNVVSDKIRSTRVLQWLISVICFCGRSLCDGDICGRVDRPSHRHYYADRHSSRTGKCTTNWCQSCIHTHAPYNHTSFMQMLVVLHHICCTISVIILQQYYYNYIIIYCYTWYFCVIWNI